MKVIFDILKKMAFSNFWDKQGVQSQWSMANLIRILDPLKKQYLSILNKATSDNIKDFSKAEKPVKNACFKEFYIFDVTLAVSKITGKLYHFSLNYAI